MDIFDRIAERKLAEAIERGEFDDFEGKGEPLELEDLSGMPEDVRASYILLKGHGVVPEELSLRRELVKLDDLLRACTDGGERRRLLDSRDANAVRLALLLEQRGASGAWSEFAQRLVERFVHERDAAPAGKTRDESATDRDR